MQNPSPTGTGELPSLDVLLVVVAALLFLGLLWALRIVRRRRFRRPAPEPELSIDLESLESVPLNKEPRLDCYRISVRLAVVVLAPLGRGAADVAVHNVPPLLDQLRSGLSQFLIPHQTLTRLWPPQLSAGGFEHAFFANVRLPGKRGRGTRWCSLAGRLEADDGRQFMVGLVLCAADSNSLGQIVIQKEHEWFDVLRIRETT